MDGDCGFRLSSLMDCWGFRNGLTEWQVLYGLRRHMLHNDGVTLRFGITCDETGDVVIRVRARPKQEASLEGGEIDETSPFVESAPSRPMPRQPRNGSLKATSRSGESYETSSFVESAPSRALPRDQRRGSFQVTACQSSPFGGLSSLRPRKAAGTMDAYALATGYGGAMPREERRAHRINALAQRRSSSAYSSRFRPMREMPAKSAAVFSPETLARRRGRFGADNASTGSIDDFAEKGLIRCKEPEVLCIDSDDDMDHVKDTAVKDAAVEGSNNAATDDATAFAAAFAQPTADIGDECNAGSDTRFEEEDVPNFDE
eukprot:TRINITY_DN39090_c0_g1_i2.p1 TRINITY_DN39090_c0_g1~~TRINITY_DN39090_c0_g1_i2.p1  ORF type:complete len:317 (+),score=55.17 TRINITY_DN39090_c0_g1_i2:244-1194(+)